MSREPKPKYTGRHKYLGNFAFGGVAAEDWMHDLIVDHQASIVMDLGLLKPQERSALTLSFANGWLKSTPQGRLPAIYKFFCARHHLLPRVISPQFRADFTTTRSLWNAYGSEFIAHLEALFSLVKDKDQAKTSTRVSPAGVTNRSVGVEPRHRTLGGVAVTLVDFYYPQSMTAAVFMEQPPVMDLFPRQDNMRLDAALTDVSTAGLIRLEVKRG